MMTTWDVTILDSYGAVLYKALGSLYEYVCCYIPFVLIYMFLLIFTYVEETY